MSGQVVTKERYFPREKDQNKIWRRLNKGGHILLLAPRRVGKTSLLHHLENNPKPEYVFFYNIVQSCDSEHEFYKGIIDNLYKSEYISKPNKALGWTKETLSELKSSLKGVKFSELGIEFDNKERQLNHKDLKTVLDSISKIDKKLVIVIDEFPDVLDKIHQDKGITGATKFLSGCRELLQSPDLDKKIQFVFTGSIGLDTLAHKLNLTNLINVLSPVSIDALSHDKALEFIDFIRKDSIDDIEITERIKQYILDRIDWNVPFYINVLWTSLEDYCYDEEIKQPTEEDVDKAYNLLFSQANRQHFIHWVERLSRYDEAEKRFAKLLLEKVAINGSIAKDEMFNLSQEEQFKQTGCNYVRDCLEHDGYIFWQQEQQQYQFTSPLLKGWWSQYAARNI